MHTERSATTGDGRKLTYVVTGSGPLLVCHPGGPGYDGGSLEDLGGLANDRTLVLVDPAGAGGSDSWTEDAYSLARRADDVDDVRKALGVERVDYLGHSGGGFVGICFAARYPAGVGKLVLVGTIARFTDAFRAESGRQTVLSASEPWFPDAHDAHSRRLARDYADDAEFQYLYRKGLPFMFARFGEREQAYVERRPAAMIDRRTLESFNDHIESLDLRPDLPRIEAETLLVNGEHEPQRAGEQELLDGIPNARLAIVEDAGHFPFVEQPERFRATVLPFLSS